MINADKYSKTFEDDKTSYDGIETFDSIVYSLEIANKEPAIRSWFKTYIKCTISETVSEVSHVEGSRDLKYEQVSHEKHSILITLREYNKIKKDIRKFWDANF